MNLISAAASEAIDLDNKGEYQKALEKYFYVAELMINMLKNNEVKQADIPSFKKKLDSFFARAEYIKKKAEEQEKEINNYYMNYTGTNVNNTRLSGGPSMLNPVTAGREQFNTTTATAANPNINQKEKEKMENVSSGDPEEDERRGQILGCIISNITTTLADVAGLSSAKDALNEAIVLPTLHPEFFSDRGVTPWKGILMYGPPGTGKSFLAEACAGELNTTFFRISASDIVSKYVGQSAKMISTLFKVARENLPAVIFIDEIDSMLSDRGSNNQTGAMKQVVNQFLIEMDGVGTKSLKQDILVLGATNVVYLYFINSHGH